MLPPSFILCQDDLIELQRCESSVGLGAGECPRFLHVFSVLMTKVIIPFLRRLLHSTVLEVGKIALKGVSLNNLRVLLLGEIKTEKPM